MKMPPTEAARIMGVSPQFIRCGLQQDKFPFGVAVKMERQWAYYINKEKFYEYITTDKLPTNPQNISKVQA